MNQQPVPGLVGLIAQWITSTAIRPQPKLSIAAAMCAVSTIIANKYYTTTYLRSNIYILSLAPTGAGKDHPRKCISKLFKEAGIAKHLGGEPGSGSGLITGLHNAKGRQLLQIDEMGKVLAGLNSKNSGYHLAEVLTLMMRLYSDSQGTFYDKQLANRDLKNPPRDMENPCLTINGTTTHERFYESVNGGDAVDGFLNRIIIFDAGENLPTRNRNYGMIQVPDEILGKVKDIIGGGFDITGMQKIPMEPEAEEIFNKWCDKIEALQRKHLSQRTKLDAIYARAIEQCLKVSLLAADFDKLTINKQCVEWAIEVIERNCTLMEDIVLNHISDNYIEAGSKKIYTIIQKSGPAGITQSALTRATRCFGVKERRDHLTDLVQGDLIDLVEISGTSKKLVTIYKAKDLQTHKF